MRINKTARVVLLIAFAGAGYASYSLFKSWPARTNDCAAELTESCLNSAISSFNYERNIPKELYYNFGRDLLLAGQYQLGLELLGRSQNSLRDTEVATWAAQQVAEEALIHPDQVASFDILKTLKDPSTPAGAILADRKRASDLVDSSFFLHLTSYLMGTAGPGGGEVNFVQFNEKSAMQNFHPTATWDYLISTARDYELQRPEPSRSGGLIILASQLRRTGYADQAYSMLHLATPNERTSSQYINELEAQGKFDEAATIRSQYLPRYVNLIAEAEHEIITNPQAAIAALKEAAALVQPSTTASAAIQSHDIVGSLLRISKLLYKAGDLQTAVEVADQARAIKSSFISAASISETYRAIGQTERAKEVMQPFLDPSTDSCSAYSEPEARAREFYALGMPDIAARKISSICGTVAVFGSQFGIKSQKVDPHKTQLASWREIYLDAFISGRDTSDIIRYAGPDFIPMITPYIAMVYLNKGDLQKGGEYLAKAITDSDYRDGAHCDWGYLAASANRDDLVELHFKRALEMISRNKKGLDRQTAYLSLAACHNQIRIQRLVASLPPLKTSKPLGVTASTP